MVDNLKIGNRNKTILLTSENSDVNSSYTLPAASSAATLVGTDTPYIYIDSTYGGYYSWFAATAGSGNKNLPTSQNAPYSICAKGWQLPTETIYKTLVAAYNNRGLNQKPQNFINGKCDAAGSCGGTMGCYWASTHDYLSNQSDAHWLYISGGVAWNKNDRYVCGISGCGCLNFSHNVRCVAR